MSTVTPSSEHRIVEGLRKIPIQSRSWKRVEELEEAARKVLRTIGREKFSLQDIADEAGCSIGTVYRYFKDPIDVLEKVWPNRQDIYYPEDE